MMGLGILLLAASLACPPIGDLPVDEPAVAVSDDVGRQPKLLDPEFHASIHREHRSVKDGAQEQYLWCGGGPVYEEFVWFSDATHTTVVGWRFNYCSGHWAKQGIVTNFCDIYRECCGPPYQNEVTTCEGP
jgi:hypothetical protein